MAPATQAARAHAGHAEAAFLTAFRGRFTGVLRWEELDDLWRNVQRNAGAGWYVYAVGEPLPVRPTSAAQVESFTAEIDTLLRREHEEDYCGIVYVDDRTAPAMIKIFDPNNLGVQCGYSAKPPLPGWVMSLLPPVELRNADPVPANRRRWWQKLWA